MIRKITDDAGSPVEIRNDLRPGDIGSIIQLHGLLYAREYGFDHTFEPYVAGPLSEFVLSKTDRERIWIVEKGGKVRGSVAIVRYSDTMAQLRWLILHPDVRGAGVGKTLVAEALDYTRASDYRSIFLWTVRGLAAATNIYLANGFRLTESKQHEIWGKSLIEERYELNLR